MKERITSEEIRLKFLNFFKKRDHIVIPSASLVTPDEKGITNSTLFNTAGMQPLVPYLLGKEHPNGKRLVDVQKCIRTIDIDDIGDKTHATFFEMLGNWSLGDYFKKEAINWSYEFLTDKEQGLGLNPEQLYVTIFEGDANAEKDTEAADIWSEIFKKNNIQGERIFYMPASMNWWEAGENGPCGPDTEMYYDISNKFQGSGLTREQFLSAENERTVVEVWNDVFMQYEKKDGKIIGKLANPSVDTGAGLERLAMTLQSVDNIYDTDLFESIMSVIKNNSSNWNIVSARIVADHIKASVMLISDGIIPSNTDRGYVLRKLIRRAIRHSDLLGMEQFASLISIVKEVQNIYALVYPNVIGIDQGQYIKKIINDEEIKFRETLKQGLKEFEKLAKNNISGMDAFSLFSSYGFPLELTFELSKEKGISVDVNGFNEQFKKHQELSRTGSEQKFKGGLLDTSEMSIRYHTATHLLHQALYDVLGNDVGQKGSNITPERLRFDFSWTVKMTDSEKSKVEEIINEKIKQALPVNNVILPREEAEETGARHFFAEKYGESISVYYIGNDIKTAYSKEFCGGPHVNNTSDLAGPEGKWKFRIIKEEAISQGIRRIKAVID